MKMKLSYLTLLISLFIVTNSFSQKSGNPVFKGWYADPEGIVFGDNYWIYPTYSAPYEKQVFWMLFLRRI